MPKGENDKSLKSYSVNAVSMRTGLSPHVLRVWERRYQVVNPLRDQAGRRQYSEADLERLHLLAQSVNRGQAIGKISDLTNEELREQLDILGKPTQKNLQETPHNGAPPLDDLLLSKIMESMVTYDMDGCYRALSAAVLGVPMDELVNEICAPIMERIGQEWEKGTINIVQEHMVCSAFQTFLLPKIQASVIGRHGPSIAFATLSEERHEMGLLFAACMAAARNLRCYYFGCDIPSNEIGEAISQMNADVLCISLVNKQSPLKLKKSLAALREFVPESCELWVGGFGTHGVQAKAIPSGCHLLDHDDYILFLDRLASQ